MNSKGQLLTIGVIILVVGALFALFASGKIFPASVFDYNQIYKANFGHVCCLSGPYETLAGPSWADAVQSTTCSEYVDSCDVILTQQAGAGLLNIGSTIAYYEICNADGSSCNSATQGLARGVPFKLTLPVGKMIKFPYSSIGTSKLYTWERKGSLYNLVGEENGKIFVTNGCYLSTELAGKVLAESPNPIPKGFSYCQNYITDFISVASRTYSYNGQNVICQGKQIYSIDSKTLKDGSIIRIQGNNIANVECCPSEPNCDASTFKFVTANTRQCTYSTECANAGNPYPSTQNTALQYSCDNGQCIQHMINVECTSDAVCQQRFGGGYVCDLSLLNYGKCIKAPSGPYCGDGICDIGDSASTCPQDCAIQCMPGEKLVTITSKVNCAIGFPLYLGCSTAVSQECQGKGFNWMILLYIAIGIILLLIAWKFGLFKNLFKFLMVLPIFIKIIIILVLIVIVALAFKW